MKKSQVQKRETSKSGLIPRPILEPEHQREPARPPQLINDANIDTSKSGIITIVLRESEDKSAIGDDDYAEGDT